MVSRSSIQSEQGKNLPLEDPVGYSGVEKSISVLSSSGARALVALAIFGLAYAADQLVKYLVQKNMELGETISVIDGVLRWRYILNPGAAFSMGENHTWVFTIIMCVAAVICLVSLIRARATVWVCTLALLLGGILGNLTDRLFRAPGFGMGHVVDFISVGNFAIFNIADSCICVSMALIVVLVFRGINLDGTREEQN